MKPQKSPVDFGIIRKLAVLLTDHKNKTEITISNLPGSSKRLLAAELFDQRPKILYLCESKKEVEEVVVELDALGIKDVIGFESFDKESIQEKLTEITKREELILVSTYSIINTELPRVDHITKNMTVIQAGGDITYDDLIEYLAMLNYNREKFVDAPGDFAVRGSIIDFWSYSEKQPSRVEYDGDFLESVRYFDHENQRSQNVIESVTLASSIEEEETDEYSTIFEYLDNVSVIANKQELERLFESKDTAEVEEIIQDAELDDELKQEFFDNNIEEETVINDEISTSTVYTKVEDLFKQSAVWYLEDLFSSDKHDVKTGLKSAPVINSNFELLFSQLIDFAKKGIQTIITAENELQAKRLNELLFDYKVELHDLIESGKVKIVVAALKEGFVSVPENLAVLTDYQVFNKPYRTKIFSKFKKRKSKSKDFASIKRGDYVVHESFGIGRYEGLEIIKIGQVEQESIKIQYAEGGIVYVNLNYLGLVKRFSSKENAAPRLSVLGSNEWKNTKKKVKKRIKEAARDLITLYAKRKATEGFSFTADSVWQKELEASFFYEDTPDQAKVTEDVKVDMESLSPMDRLVCGDVGFGKTEIAVRAAFKAVNDGKQVALLVPTTILAEQHHNTFKDRLSQFPVKIAALSRFQTKAEQTEIVKKLASGGVDIVIGTHRLLSKDIKFKDIGLLIIDEEHRFGVMAKEKLKQYRINVDTLTLTATPIPRTLNLSLLGARDLSIIATPPPNRQPIYTKVEKFDIHHIRKWIVEELKRGGQIYFVHDRVQSIEKIGAYIQKHIPELKIGVAHGQMKPADLEKVIYQFLHKEFDMLISTKIIESGIDIPNVNTIIVNRADRFGLAELHQLRGRVGRSDRQAYAFFLVPSLKTITKKAVRRLQAIEEYTDLGGGFNLSMRDLEIRGAGNLLGTEQSGAIDTVGFDLYVKMLDEAVEELKQDEFKEVFKDLPKHQERTEPTIDAYFEIGIPNSFMPDQADRLSYYSALFSMANISEVDEIKEELEDKYGKLPFIVERLIHTAILRFHASFAMFERIIIQRERIALILPKADKEHFYKEKFTELMQYVMQKHHKKIRFVQGKDSMKLEMGNEYTSPEAALKYLTSFSKEIEREVMNSSDVKLVEV